jgi:hypothetical protein
MFAVGNDVCSAPTYSLLGRTWICVKAEIDIGGCSTWSAIIDSYVKVPEVEWMICQCQETPELLWNAWHWQLHLRSDNRCVPKNVLSIIAVKFTCIFTQTSMNLLNTISSKSKTKHLHIVLLKVRGSVYFIIPLRSWALFVPQDEETVERNKCSTTEHMRHLSLTVILSEVRYFRVS